MQVGKRCLSAGPFCWCLLALAVMALSAGAQTSASNEWTWIGGHSTLLPINGAPSNVGWPGVYGTSGVPAVTNAPGGRDSAATWTDQSGNLWLFGGLGHDSAGNIGDLNDLWEFNTSTQEWTWIGGSSSLPIPQIETGQPGVYGTLGVAALGNVPGGRTNSVTWTDKKGNLWLFGGKGYSTIGSLTGNIFFNDLWEFKSSTKEWAWMGGDNQTGIADWGQSGVYGILGRPAAQNVPGGRSSAVSWIDGDGNLWLFGGAGFDSAGYSGDLNDLWEFNLSTNQWAWMGGSSAITPGFGGRPGVYGTLGIPAEANVPGGREGAIGWSDSSGNFWLFGGQGYDSGNSGPNNAGYLNDLWEFSPTLNEWTWMGGSSTLPCNDVCGQPGAYGTLGDPSAANIPGGREKAVSWSDRGGNLWLFGGVGFASTGTYNILNDLWEFNPSAKKWAWMGGNTTMDPCRSEANCGWPGLYGRQGTPAAGNNPGSREMGAGWTDHDGTLWLFGGYGDDAAGFVANLNDVWRYSPSATHSFPVAAMPTFSPAEGTYTSSLSVAITDVTPGALIYYTTDGVTIPTTGSAQYASPIPVSANETIQAVAVARNYLNSSIASAAYSINFPAPDFSFAVSPIALTVAAGQSRATTVSVTPANGFASAVSFSCSHLSTGASCSFSPATVTPSGTAATTTLTVTTPATSAAMRRNLARLFPGSGLVLALCCFGWKKRRLRMPVLLAVSVTGLGLLSGCSGGGSSSTQPVTSTITITATSGSLQHKTTLTLTVN